MEEFLNLILWLAIIGGLVGVVFGVVASFVRVGMQLAPIIVVVALCAILFQFIQ